MPRWGHGGGVGGLGPGKLGGVGLRRLGAGREIYGPRLDVQDASLRGLGLQAVHSGCGDPLVLSSAKFKLWKKGIDFQWRLRIERDLTDYARWDHLRMTSSLMSGYGKAMVGVWRAHTSLDESDEAEGSPEAPDRFRKLRSSSSLNSLRMTLRKRLPLRSVQTNSLPENPTWETLQEPIKPSTMCKLARGARQSVGGAYLRLQKTREARQEECLVSTPGRVGEPEEGAASTSHTPKRTPGRPGVLVATPTPRRTPRTSATPGRTPGSRRRSATKGTPKGADDARGVRPRGGRRQLVRMAALRSPFASPNTQNQRRKFDQDLESVSSGLRRLKHLSRAFDSFIGRDDRTNGMERAGGSVMRKLDPNGKLSRSNLTRRATKLSHTLGDWAHTTTGNIRKA